MDIFGSVTKCTVPNLVILFCDQVSGYYDDQKLSQTEPDEKDGDDSIKRRYDRFSLGKRVRLYGPVLSSGVTQCHKVFPSLTKVKITFTKSDGAFQIVRPTAADGDYFIKIDDACLNLKR